MGPAGLPDLQDSGAREMGSAPFFFDDCRAMREWFILGIVGGRPGCFPKSGKYRTYKAHLREAAEVIERRTEQRVADARNNWNRIGQSPASTKIKSKAGVPHSAPMAFCTIEECGARAESRDTYPAKGRLFRCDVAVRNGR